MSARRKSIVVVGGTGAIGGAVVESLKSEGANVVSWSLATMSELADLSMTVDCVVQEEVDAAMAATVRAVGQVDGIVHCVGDIDETIPIAEMTLSRFERTYRLCVGSALLVAKTSDRLLRESSGSAVFISSVASTHPYPGIADYCSAKAALDAFVRSWAVELATAGARVNAIRPAVIDSPLFDRSPYTREEAAGWHALNRIGRPEEIASLACWLMSDASSWMTGSVIQFDGGMSLS